MTLPEWFPALVFFVVFGVPFLLIARQYIVGPHATASKSSTRNTRAQADKPASRGGGYAVTTEDAQQDYANAVAMRTGDCPSALQGREDARVHMALGLTADSRQTTSTTSEAHQSIADDTGDMARYDPEALAPYTHNDMATEGRLGEVIGLMGQGYTLTGKNLPEGGSWVELPVRDSVYKAK